MQQIRFYFALFPAHQTIAGVTSAYKAEINKLRHFSTNILELFTLKDKTLKKYPYKLTFTYYIYKDSKEQTKDIDFISLTTITCFILHELELYNTLQSTDYRVIQELTIKTKITLKRELEGLELSIIKV